MRSSVLFGAILGFASAVLGQTPGFNPISSPTQDQNLKSGEDFKIVWQHNGAPDDAKVTIKLLQGKTPSTLQVGPTITTNHPSKDGQFTWSVPRTLDAFDTYGFSISLDNDPAVFQYSFPFHITGLGSVNAPQAPVPGSAPVPAPAPKDDDDDDDDDGIPDGPDDDKDDDGIPDGPDDDKDDDGIPDGPDDDKDDDGIPDDKDDDKDDDGIPDGPDDKDDDKDDDDRDDDNDYYPHPTTGFATATGTGGLSKPTGYKPDYNNTYPAKPTNVIPSNFVTLIPTASSTAPAKPIQVNSASAFATPMLALVGGLLVSFLL
ncbi:hypothetical protein K3495_g11672 [Podosphaera aphanis]|nr:hypothetical protein K3495_g11672 [Podosphaera aphanis]